MGIVKLSRHLRLNLGIPAIRHYYALAKSSGRQGRYFLRAKDTDHHLVAMLTSFGKRVDDVMVVVRGNWEFGEGEDRLDPVPRQKGEPGGHVVPFFHAFLILKTALEFFGRPNLQKQGRAAHILANYCGGVGHWPIEQSVGRTEGEKPSAEFGADLFEELVDKRPRMEKLQDIKVPFIIQPKIKNTPISVDASALKNPVVVLSVASSISLPVDRAVFRAEPDVVLIALAAQSAVLAAGRIVEISRQHYDVVEQIGSLKVEIETEKNKAKEALAELAVASLRADFEAKKAEEEQAKADAEEEKAKCSDLLRVAAKERASVSEEALKLAKKAIAKLEADLEESRKAKEIVDFEVSKAFNAGEVAALEKYVEKVPKFENRGCKQGWLKALAVANVVLEQPISYKQLEVEPLEPDPEELV
ncbi:hypothetical protein CsSME_00052800 [Camellia sinensis var. sinensis]